MVQIVVQMPSSVKWPFRRLWSQDISFHHWGFLEVQCSLGTGMSGCQCAELGKHV